MTEHTSLLKVGTWVFALAAAPAVARAQGAASLAVRAENTLAIARGDETIAIAWPAIRQQLPSARAGNVRVVDGAGKEVVSQLVDDDGDGTPDALIFQGTFAPGETKAFAIEAAAPAAAPTSRTFALHDEPRDDIAWESDRIAFRMYGQGLKKTSSAMSSNGVDVWVKSVHELVVDKWYKKGHDAYHVDTGEGADFYDVGETLGAGGTGIWRDGKLYRFDNFTAYKILANGPVRTTFELQYPTLDAGGLQLTETKRVSIDAGQNMNRVTSTFRVAGAAAEVPYVLGLVKRKGMIGSESKANAWAWLTGWGPVTPKNGGHGEMGTAVLLPRASVADWKETDDHYLAISRARSAEPVVYYVGAGWTSSGDFRDVRDWWGYLDQFAARLAAPLKITVGGAMTSAR
jgi:uncharacterized protein DUF4861